MSTKAKRGCQTSWKWSSCLVVTAWNKLESSLRATSALNLWDFFPSPSPTFLIGVLLCNFRLAFLFHLLASILYESLSSVKYCCWSFEGTQSPCSPILIPRVLYFLFFIFNDGNKNKWKLKLLKEPFVLPVLCHPLDVLLASGLTWHFRTGSLKLSSWWRFFPRGHPKYLVGMRWL